MFSSANLFNIANRKIASLLLFSQQFLKLILKTFSDAKIGCHYNYFEDTNSKFSLFYKTLIEHKILQLHYYNKLKSYNDSNAKSILFIVKHEV